jgi:hypothetical protein
LPSDSFVGNNYGFGGTGESGVWEGTQPHSKIKNNTKSKDF